MLDKFLYGFFGGLDNLCAGISNYLFRAAKKNTEKK